MISIIIPTFNRPGMLTLCLESLTRQDYPKEQFEVIVVNDGGDQDLSAIVEPVSKIINVRLMNQRKAGPATARNTGVASSNGQFIAFTDDDCTPSADWLTVFASRLQQNPSRMYGGHTINALKGNIYSAASQSLVDYLYGYAEAHRGHARFFTSNNIAVARNMFESVGGFDTSFPGACGEDRELCDRWLGLGHEMSFVPEAKVFHHHELTLRTFWKQHFNYGAGAFLFRQCRARRGLMPLRFEPPAFYLGLVGHGWKEQGLRSAPLSALMALSQLANVAGFGWAKFFNR